MQAGTIVGSGSYVPDYVPPDHATGQTPNATPFWMVGGAGAEVEIDTETGQIRVLRLVTVADAGTPVNPRIVETQLTGAAIMQLGFTLFEEMEFTDGQLRNPSFAEYKIPGIRDLPERIEAEAVDAAQQSGPYGAKGIGETGTFGVSPAIANAITAARLRIHELPITRRAIHRALRARPPARPAGRVWNVPEMPIACERTLSAPQDKSIPTMTKTSAGMRLLLVGLPDAPTAHRHTR